jgi:cytochrome c oxidase subunit 4
MSPRAATGPHIVSPRIYLTVAVLLLLLTAVTVAVSYVPLGGFNVVVALCIAALKASLVALFFMHLKYDRKIYAIIFVGAVLFLALFIIFTMFDTMYREGVYEINDAPVRPEAMTTDMPAADSIIPEVDSQAVVSDSPGGP